LRLNFVDLDVVSSLGLVPDVTSFFADVEHVDAVEGLVSLVDLLKSDLFETASVTGSLIGQCLPDNLLESMMVHSEDKDSLQSLF